jgi:hypothetical protein
MQTAGQHDPLMRKKNNYSIKMNSNWHNKISGKEHILFIQKLNGDIKIIKKIQIKLLEVKCTMYAMKNILGLEAWFK